MFKAKLAFVLAVPGVGGNEAARSDALNRQTRRRVGARGPLAVAGPAEGDLGFGDSKVRSGGDMSTKVQISPRL